MGALNRFFKKAAPMKYIAVVGVCLVVFFVATMTPHAYKKPIVPEHKENFFIGLNTASAQHKFKHMSKKCQTALLALEKEEEKDGGKSHEHGHGRECKDGQMAVLLSRTVNGKDHKLSKCFPEEECKCENIKKELEEGAKAHDKEAAVEVSCGNTDETKEGEKEGEEKTKEGKEKTKEGEEKTKEGEKKTNAPTKMSDACRDALKELEQEEKDNDKKNQEEGHGRKCEKGQMIVKVTNKIHSMERKYSKCFPKDDCKCQNIEKELDDHAKALHSSGKVKVECE